MKDTIIPSDSPTLEEVNPSALDGIARRVIFSLLKRLDRGKITVHEGDTQQSFGKQRDDFPFEAKVIVHHPRFYSSILLGGASALVKPIWQGIGLRTSSPPSSGLLS